MPDDFHARHRAVRRSYRYYILNRSARSPLQRDRAAWIHRKLDADLLNETAQVLLGEHDFSAFRSVECQSKSATRRIDILQVRRAGDYVWRPKGSRHLARSPGGALVISFFLKPNKFLTGALAGKELK